MTRTEAKLVWQFVKAFAKRIGNEQSGASGPSQREELSGIFQWFLLPAGVLVLYHFKSLNLEQKTSHMYEATFNNIQWLG